MSATIGSLLSERYRLDAEIGRGGMGIVYRAYDTVLERAVAVKVLSEATLDRESRARLLREAQAAAQLNHPNLASVHDAGEAEGVPFIVMELVEGPSLHQQPPEDMDEIVDLAGQVCAALAHAHAHGIVHRDLKPENVLLSPDGTAKLVDFGLARTVASRLTAEGAILGTLLYLAPEQAQGGEIDGRADLYALGVMLYEWATGRLPFADAPPAVILSHHLHTPVVPPREHNDEIPPALDALIVQLLHKRPEERPASATEVQQALEALAGPATAMAPGELPGERVRLRGFLLDKGEEPEEQRPAFVAREGELAWLDGSLAEALGGQGGVAFVTGGPGRGKTALLDAFARQAMEAHPELLVAGGTCNAYSGLGDAYLPFREVLGQLTGEVEARWAAGAIGREQARRLWGGLPAAVEALLAHGPHVIPALLPGEALPARAERACPDASWLGRLRERVARDSARASRLEQSHLFQQVSNVLRALAEAHPLLLMVDDLQWVDRTSAGLLFHLGRQIEGSPILIVGAYRPEELTPRPDGERHPLDKVLAEFKRLYGDVWLDLAEVEDPEGRCFVDAFLETEPNLLGEGFRQALAERAGGHPLFTVELLRAMQERGDLVRDEAGRWVEGPALDWRALPARVEGVIAERIERLTEDLRDVLSVASVEGEDFTAEVVAQVRAVEARDLVRRLSGELQREHRLVRARGLRRLDARRLALYRFQHHLFQKYLYNHLDEAERAYLHEDVGTVLEALYGEQTDEVAVQLARHFVEAGVTDKAAHYLGRAGELAAERYANEEALAYLSQALGYVPEDAAQRLNLLATRAQVYGLVAEWDEQRADLEALLALAEALEDDTTRCDALIALAECLSNTGDAGSREPAERAAELARKISDPLREGRALRFLGQLDSQTGHLVRSRRTLEAALARLQEAGQPGETAACLADLSLTLGWLQEFSLALQAGEQAVALSRVAGDRRWEATSLRRVAIVHIRQAEFAAALPVVEAALALHRQIGDRHEECHALNALGSTLGGLGEPEAAAGAFEQMLELADEIGAAWLTRYGFGNMIYNVFWLQGEYEAALAVVETWLAKARQAEDEVLLARLWVEKTDLLVSLGQLEPALEAAPSVLSDTDRLLDHREQSMLLDYIGYCQVGLGRFVQAREKFQAGLEKAEQAGETADAVRWLVHLAYVACLEGDRAGLRAAMETVQRRGASLPAADTRGHHLMARLHLAQGDVERALESSNSVVRRLEASGAGPFVEQCYWTHACVLRTLGRDDEADDYLQRAYDRVMLIASKTQDEDLRRGWLENVPDNREILAEWEARRKGA